MPNLTEKQQNLLSSAPVEKLNFWMNELFPGISGNIELNKLYTAINKERLRRDGLKV
jgi:hypothetical protein